MRDDGKDEAEGDDCADEIAGDHDPLAVQSIEYHAGQRPMVIAGMARASRTPVTTMPECVSCMASARRQCC